MDEKRAWIQKLQEEAEIPEIVWQKAEQSFQMIREKEHTSHMGTDKKSGKIKKKRSRFTKKKIAIVILAATLTVSTLTVGAATYFQLNKSFSERYHVSPELEKKISDSNITKELTQYTEHDGVSIEAVQSVADRHVAHIILMVKGSNEFNFDNHMDFGSVDVRVDDKRTTFSGWFLDDTTNEKRTEGTEYEIFIEDSSEEGLLNKEITLTFQNVVDQFEGKVNKTEYPVIVEATWELKLALDNEESGRTYEVDQVLAGDGTVIKSIHLTSVSYSMEMKWTPQTEILMRINENGEEEPYEHTTNPPGLVGVVYKDGSSREGVSAMLDREYINEDKTEIRQIGYHIELIDYENVSELIISTQDGLVHVPVKQ